MQNIISAFPSFLYNTGASCEETSERAAADRVHTENDKKNKLER